MDVPMQTAAQKYPWTDELERTVVTSLVTSFGLDFLLFKDQTGGNVNTIHNVRQGVWATESERQKFEQRGEYKSKDYHTHPNYKATGDRDKASQQGGNLNDPYRSTTMGAHEQRNLDHVISAKEVHDDPGRVLAELSGVELANQASNLQTTQETVNKSKKQSSISDYLARLPNLIAEHEATLEKSRARLATLPRDTPEERHKARILEDKILKTENKVEQLKAIDPAAMCERDAEARAPYERQVNHSYYTGKKFLWQTAGAAGTAGIAMGTRQVLGLVLAEVWFELRQQLPILYNRLRHNFSLEAFIDGIVRSLKGIWRRVQARFRAFLTGFGEGVFAGVLSSLSTTVLNIFATTQKMAIKIIREMWGHLCRAIRLMVFNPDQLGTVDLCKGVTELLSTGAAAVVGTMAYAQLLPVCSFPFGGELATCASTVLTGLLTLGLNYVLLHGPMAHRLWASVEKLVPRDMTLESVQAINVELDRYLLEFGRLEVNIEVQELEAFSLELAACEDEFECSAVLQRAVEARGIELPFEMGNAESTRTWLISMA